MFFVLSCAFVHVIIIYCLIFIFFIHYCSVDSSHPSSHPPSATDGAAGANATDNANASLVNGTSRTPSLFCLIDFSPDSEIPSCVLNCTGGVCACDYPLRDPTPETA